MDGEEVIAIISYGSGNVQAIANIYRRLGVPFMLAESADHLANASHYVLPGVGAFDQCMSQLNASGMRGALERHVRAAGKPILGICVGMQMLAHSSEEGVEPGLAWIEGAVKLFDLSKFHQTTRLPHMGWNTVEPKQQARLFEGVDLTTGYYFLHSYYFAPAHEEDVLATTVYGDRFASAVHHKNVFGVQFHPEKSHQAGIELLKNFSLL